MDGFLVRRSANSLESALAGAPAVSAEQESLVAFAAELRENALNIAPLRFSAARREELRTAVLAQRAAERRRPVARARGAVLGVAALAGGGLVVASAATGSNPAVLVADVAREIPKLATHSEQPPTIAIEGEVVATHDGGRTLEVRDHANVVVIVQAPEQARDVTDQGRPIAAEDIAEGATVRVTADRAPASNSVAAKKIEVLPTPVSARPDLPTGNTDPVPTKPAVSIGNVAPVETPRPTQTPSPTRTPAASPTPKPAVTNVAIAPVDPAPTTVPTRTPTADVKRTPHAGSTDPLSRTATTPPLPQ